MSTLELLDVIVCALRASRGTMAALLRDVPFDQPELDALSLFAGLLPEIEAPRNAPRLGGVPIRPGVTDSQIASAAQAREIALTPVLVKDFRAMEFAALAVLQ